MQKNDFDSSADKLLSSYVSDDLCLHLTSLLITLISGNWNLCARRGGWRLSGSELKTVQQMHFELITYGDVDWPSNIKWINTAKTITRHIISLFSYIECLLTRFISCFYALSLWPVCPPPHLCRVAIITRETVRRCSPHSPYTLYDCSPSSLSSLTPPSLSLTQLWLRL